MRRVTWVVYAVALAAAAAGCGKKKGGGGGGGGGGGAIDKAKAEAISKLEVPGYKVTSRRAMSDSAVLSVEAEKPLPSGAKMGALITISACMMCVEMDLAKWKDNANLKSMLSRVHIDNPNAVWEVNELDLGGGKKAIYTYSKSAVDGATSHGLTVYHNNGTNMVMMMVNASGLWGKTMEELEKEASLEDFKTAAQQMFAPFANQI